MAVDVGLAPRRLERRRRRLEPDEPPSEACAAISTPPSSESSRDPGSVAGPRGRAGAGTSAADQNGICVGAGRVQKIGGAEAGAVTALIHALSSFR